MLCELPNDKTEFMAHNFAQSMTGKPFSSQALDLWIECMMNKGSGWKTNIQNEKQLLVSTRNANNIGRIRAAIQNSIQYKTQTRKHTEFASTRMKLDEKAVQDLISCFDEFDALIAFPFDSTSPNLRTLQSALSASEELQHDISTALADGNSKLDNFMKERVYSKELSIHTTIKKILSKAQLMRTLRSHLVRWREMHCQMW